MKTFEQWLDIINDEVNSFIQIFNEDYTAEIGSDFCCYPTTGEIEWSLLIVDSGGIAFFKNFCSRYPEVVDFNIFTLSLLHEIGHLETVLDMDFESTRKRASGLTNEQYFELHDEKIATDWAGNWIHNNYSLAKATDDYFSNLLSQFYADVITE